MVQLVHMRIWFTEIYILHWTREIICIAMDRKIYYYQLSTCWCLLVQSCKMAWSKTSKGHIPRGWDNPWRAHWTRLGILLQGHPIISFVHFNIWQFLLADFLHPVIKRNLKIILGHQKKLVLLGLADDLDRWFKIVDWSERPPFSLLWEI